MVTGNKEMDEGEQKYMVWARAGRISRISAVMHKCEQGVLCIKGTNDKKPSLGTLTSIN